ncbi:MAG: LssY C-terminal domain-containing protein, partial [Candidatus Entotheonellia bacterium]
MLHTHPPERKQEPGPPSPKRHRLWKRTAVVAGVVVVGYLVAAYFVLPMFWMRYTRHHPAFTDIPGITHTADDIPGDPLNVALIGTESDLQRIMRAAQWDPSDPLTLRSRLEIASAAVFEHPYDDAPVSNLYLWGRKEDLAFEQPVGNDPRQRHHVRFWRSDKLDPDGRPVWVGAAIFDQ